MSLTDQGGSCATGDFSDLFTLQGTTASGFSIGGSPVTVANSGAGCSVTGSQPATAQTSFGNVTAGDHLTVARAYTLSTAGAVGGSATISDATHPCSDSYTATGTGP